MALYFGFIVSVKSNVYTLMFRKFTYSSDHHILMITSNSVTDALTVYCECCLEDSSSLKPIIKTSGCVELSHMNACSSHGQFDLRRLSWENTHSDGRRTEIRQCSAQTLMYMQIYGYCPFYHFP